MNLFGRLRTQLIVSHLIAITFTLVTMVTAVVLLAGNWFAHQQGALGEPAQQARTVAEAIGPLAVRGGRETDLNVALRLLASQRLAVSTEPSWASESGPPYARPGGALHDVSYIVVVGSNDQPLASSEPTGASFSPPERVDWGPLVRAADNSISDPRTLVWTATSGQPAALGAYPIFDNRGQPVATVVVATRVPPPAEAGASFWHSLAIVGAASAAVLVAASLFALLSASIVGYLLSRHLVGRLERLGVGVERLAAGDLTRRVDEGPSDEVGQLTRRFNAMAERLSSTVAELGTARDRAEAALLAKRDLVANVSHELRTPLALIRSHVEALQMRGCDEDGSLGSLQEEYLRIVARETENLSRLVDDLFALSTVETGTLALNLEPVQLDEVVDEVARGLRPIARRERQITVLATTPAQLPTVKADRRRVVQILGNLTRNALRYTPEGGLIALHAERQDGGVVVSVEDTGEGIPPEQLPHVFERFYRGDDSRDRASGGAGLGLAIVRELVEAMGGEVNAESVVGHGSRFSFRLPTVG